MRMAIIHWMNKHTPLAVLLLLVIGYSLHLVYEYGAESHWPKPFLAFIVFVGAAIAGWAVDLVFTKNEEEAGEID